VFAGKKRMGERGRRERVSLNFSTSCLRVEFLLKTDSCFLVSVLIVKVGKKCTLVVVWVRVAYLVWKLWVAGYSFCENVHAGRHCDPRDVRFAVRLCTTVHLQTAWNSTTRIQEVRRANAVITPGRGV